MYKFIFKKKQQQHLSICQTHQTPPRRFCTLFFEVLPFTDDAIVVNGKLQRKACKNDAAVFGVSRPLKKSMQKRRGGFWCVKAF